MDRRLVLANDPPGMNYTRNPPQYRQANVDEEVGAATALEDDCNRWNKDCEEVK